MTFILENIWVLGALIVVLVFFQALLLTYRILQNTLREKKQREDDIEYFSTKIALAHQKKIEKEKAPAHWEGWRKFVVKKKVLEDPSKQVCSFYLSPQDGRPISAFEPGQFLTFQLKIPGQPKPVMRCYSLSDSPNPNYYRVSIKRVPAPRDKPDAPPGLSSNFFHDHIEEGTVVDVKNPSGSFYLDLSRQFPVVLIGGGVGLTPVVSMLNTIIERNDPRETWFFYGVRHRGEHAMRDHLKEMAKKAPNVKVLICYSDPTENDKQGEDYDYASRVSVELFKKVLPSNNYDYYMCGPPPMMDSLVQDLGAWGVPKDHVHLESFGPASSKKFNKKKVDDTKAEGPLVTFKKSGESFSWDPSFENLWEFASSHDVSIDSGCLAGNCGTCQVTILSGKVEYADPPEAACEEDGCLVCSCTPKGSAPLELDA